MPDALVAADLHLAPDVRGDLAAQVALDLEIGFDVVAELDDLFVGQVLGPLAGVDTGRRQRFRCTGPADAQEMTAPVGSVIETIVLLNVLLICA